MALADAFGADAPYDPGQGVDDLPYQTFPGDNSDSGVADPGRLSDTLMRRRDPQDAAYRRKPPEGARLIAIAAFGLVAFLIVIRISRDREATKDSRCADPGRSQLRRPSALLAYGEQDAETLRTCPLAGHFVKLEKRNVP
jgi:hypothetical protein